MTLVLNGPRLLLRDFTLEDGYDVYAWNMNGNQRRPSKENSSDDSFSDLSSGMQYMQTRI